MGARFLVYYRLFNLMEIVMAREVTGQSKGSLLALALGAAAFGATAIGALAVGRLVVGHLLIGRIHFRELKVDTLTVRRLRIIERDGSSA